MRPTVMDGPGDVRIEKRLDDVAEGYRLMNDLEVLKFQIKS